MGAPGVTAAFVGVLTGIGGGMIRDVLVREIPTVLRREIYALAALVGAFVVVGGTRLGLPPVPVALAGAVSSSCCGCSRCGDIGTFRYPGCDDDRDMAALERDGK